jgi:tetratricopeptide (TPR) repeat protein
MQPAAGRQGEAFSAEITVRGAGNVALWPQPDLRWPVGFRVYPEAATEQLAMRDGRLTGAKTFKFMLVADSAGALALPPVRYPYYDLDDQRYRASAGPSALVVVAPRGEAVASRAEPPPIRLERRRPAALALREALPDPIWWVIALSPILLVLAMRWPRRRKAEPEEELTADPLARAEHQLSALLARGGLAPPDAKEVQELRQRVLAARFAGQGRAGVRELTMQVEAAIARVAPPGASGRRRWRERTGIAVLLVLAVGSRAVAQTQPEEYYNAGAYRAAADGFRRRALSEPDIATHWFNLGNAAYRAGDDAAALAAWVRAARLSPRDGGIRRARLLMAPADEGASSALWVSPVTPAELWLLGLVAWLGGWAGVLWSRQMRGRWAVLLGGGALLASLATGLDQWYQAPIAITEANEQLRLSPHELAPAVGEVARLGTVRLETPRGGWVLVDAGGQRGWIRRDRVEPLSGVFPR